MAVQDAPFYPEIEALDENFYEFYYAYQRDWLERHQINFQAVHSLWDILNNVWDNLGLIPEYAHFVTLSS